MGPWMCYWNDNLVRRFWRETNKGKEYSYHGKRVGNNYPLTREQIRVYVENGPVKVIKMFKEDGLTIREGIDKLNSIRGRNSVYQPYIVNR